MLVRGFARTSHHRKDVWIAWNYVDIFMKIQTRYTFRLLVSFRFILPFEAFAVFFVPRSPKRMLLAICSTLGSAFALCTAPLTFMFRIASITHHQFSTFLLYLLLPFSCASLVSSIPFAPRCSIAAVVVGFPFFLALRFGCFVWGNLLNCKM